MRTVFQILLVLFFASFTTAAFAQASGFPVKNGIEFSPRLLDNLLFLNNMGEKPLPIEQQMLYKWAETGLIRNEKQGFAFLANYNYFQNYCKKHNIFNLGGPMLGNVSETGVDVWLRTVKPAEVSVKVNVDGKIKTFGPVKSTLESELSAVVSISGLKPDQQYFYEVFVDGKKLDLQTKTILRTSPKSENTETRIVFGSCFHRWGLGNQQQTNTILSHQPHAFLMLGDIAAQDKMNHVGWHSLDYLARDLYPAWQDLVSKIPVYATWDDHDYFGDDLWGIPSVFTAEDRSNVWNVFRNSWANPSYGFGENGGGVFLKTRIGAADVIMLDNRYFRTKDSFLGKKQMQWFEEQLIQCNAPFIIISCGTMWSDYVSGGKDSWGQFGAEAREEIFKLIEKNNIKGVLLISGDRHGARGFTIPRPSGFQFYEFEGGSLGGVVGPETDNPKWETRLYGIDGVFAFSEFTFNANKKDPTVTFCLIKEDGEVLYEKQIKLSELTPTNYK